MSLLGAIGTGITDLGHAIGAPDIGIGKFLGSSNALPGLIQGVSPATYQGVGVVHPNNLYGAPSRAGVATPSPAAGNSGGVVSSGYNSGSGSTTTVNPSAQLISDQLARLPGQQQVGLNNINNSYQSALNALLNSQASAKNTYDTNTAQTQKDNQTAKDNIAVGVHQGLSGLQRLLGANGAGSSSAATVLAPYAAGFEGNQQQQQVQSAYGANKTALDQSWQDAQNQFTNDRGNLDAQKADKTNSLLAQILGTKSQLLASQGAAPSTINDLGKQIDALGAQPTFTPALVNYAAPNLTGYDYNPSAAPTDPNAGSLGTNLGSFYNLVNPQDKQKQQTSSVAPVVG